MTAEAQPKKKRRVSMCVGCGGQIQDQFILRVAPDLEWHAACLKCADCNQYLDETCTCFVRDGKTYCKRDYVRLFGAKCAKCSLGFNKNDFVMRARNKIYHIDCFRCVACSRQLIPGDEFALRDDGLFCKADHEVVERAATNGSNGSDVDNNNINGERNNNNNNEKKPNLHTAEMAGPVHVRQGLKTSDGSANGHKPSRIRTVLTEKQLYLLKTCYTANPRPNARVNEQLAEMSGLPQRAVRVWFQNRRNKRVPGQTEIRILRRYNKLSNTRLRPTNKKGQAEQVTSSGRSGARHVHKQEHKPTRVRTVLNEKQLHTLRTCYNANPRPDALMKEQLVEMTSLSPRVIRVWFQNKRCKDKKKTILMKQMAQQQEKNGHLTEGPYCVMLQNGTLQRTMTGVPMIASSPVRHEQNLQGNAVEVTSYQPPWKALSDFAMQSELDQPPYQQLMYEANESVLDLDSAVYKHYHSEVNSFDHMDNLSNESSYLMHDDGLSHPPTSVSDDLPGTPSVGSELGSPMSQ